jgi:hypothetical protein
MYRYIVIFLCFCSPVILAKSDGTTSYGFSRINENINFFLNGDVMLDNQLGKFHIKQEYFGNSYLLNNNINDNQKFAFIWSKRAIGNLNYHFKNNIQYVGNNFNTGSNNNLLNFNLLPGLKYDLNNDGFLALSYGLDQHSQVDVISNSGALSTDFNYSFKYDDFQFDTKYDNYYTQRTLERDFNTNNAKINILRLGENSMLNFSSDYNTIQNDFIRSSENEIQIENRFENRMNLSLDLSYYLFDNFKNEMNISYFLSGRDNSYKEFDNNNPRSGVFEVRDLNTYNLYTRFTYEMKKSFIRFAIQHRNETLSNQAKSKFDISINDLVAQQNNISLLDYRNQFTRFYYDNYIYINKKNELFSDFVFEINRYDTPSENENRDRDQLIMRYSQKYNHIFSEVFSGGIELEGRYRHLVYLKKENSINNVKERSLKFAPYFQYKNKNLEMTPEFQIFVNYRSFDYEFLFQSIRSDVQRSLTLRDSINYYINNNFRFNVSYLYRFRETGLFSWERFSQSISEIKNEFYSNSVLYYHKNANYYGIGFRYYDLELLSQRSLGNLGNESFFLRSLSPVVDIGIKIRESTRLVAFGWYEFQDLKVTKRVIPNLRLETIIDLN